MRKLLRYLIINPLLVLLFVIILIVAAGGLLSATQTGTGLLIQLAERFLPDIQLEDVQGTLLDRVQAGSLLWERDGIRIEAKEAVFAANMRFQLPLDLIVEELAIKQLTIDLPPSEGAPYEPFELPDLSIRLPVELALGRVAVEDLLIRQGETEIKVKGAALSAHTDDGFFHLDHLLGALYDGTGSVDIRASGQMALDKPHPLDLKATVTSAGSVFGAGALDLSAEGELQNYHLTTQGVWAYADYPEYQLALSSRGNLESMHFYNLALQGEPGEVWLRGGLTWSPQLSWDLHAQGNEVNPESFLTDLPGDLDLELSSQGTLAGGGNASVELLELSGDLRGYPLQGAAEVDWQQQDLLIRTVDVQVGDNRLQAEGRVNDELQVDWALEAPDLQQLYPSLEGDVSSSGSLAGKTDGTQFMLRINELVGELMQQAVSAKGVLRLEKEQLSASDFRLALGDNKIQVNGVADEEGGLDWQVELDNLSQLQGSLQGYLQGKGNLRGRLDGSRLALKVSELEGEVQSYPIKASGGARFDQQQLFLDGVQLAVGDNALMLNGILDEEKGLDWQLQAKNLTQLHADIPGQLSGQGNVKGVLDASRIQLQVANLQGEIQSYPIRLSGVASRIDEQLAVQNLRVAVANNQLQLNGVLDEEQGVAWNLQAPDLKRLHASLNGGVKGLGHLRGDLNQQALSLEIKDLSGRIENYPLRAQGGLQWRQQILGAQDLQLLLGANRLSLDGLLNETSGLRWVLQAPELAQINPALVGGLNGRGQLRGVLDGSRIALNVEDLQGKLNGYSLKVSGAAYRQNQQIRLDKLHLISGDNQIFLNGPVDEKVGLQWRLDARQLKQLHPTLQGALQGNGVVRVPLDGSWVALRINQLQGRLQSYPLQAQGALQFQTKAQRLAMDGLRLSVGANQIRLQGVLDQKQGVTWRLDAQQLSQLHSAAKGNLSGQGLIRGRLDGSDIAVQIGQLQGRVQGYPASARGLVRMQQGVISARQLLLASGENRLLLDGVVNEQQGLVWSLDAKRLVQLSPTVDGQLQGQGRLQANLQAERFLLQVNRLQGRVKQYPLQLTGRVIVQRKHISAQNVSIASGQNRLLLNGDIAEQLKLSWSLDARNLAQLSPEVKGFLKGGGQVSGKLDGSQILLQVGRLQGRVNERPVQLLGQVNVVNQKHITLNQVQLLAGRNRVLLNGQANEPFNLSWNIQAPDLGQVLPAARGSVQGQGVLRGRLSQPQVQGRLSARQLAYQDLQLGLLDAQISQRGAHYDLRAKLGNLKQGDQVITVADLSVQGQINRHQINLSATHSAGRLVATAGGGWHNQQWRGSLQQLLLQGTAAGDWRLAQAWPLMASAKRVTLGNSCLLNRQNTQICTQLDWVQGRGVQSKGTLQRVPLSMAAAVLPPSVKMTGVLTGDYQFDQRGGRPFARLNIVLPDNAVRVMNAQNRPETFHYSNARLNATINDKVVQLQAQMDVRGKGNIRTQGQIRLGQAKEQHQIDLRTRVTVPNIAWIQRFAPQIDELKGQVNGDVRVVGRLIQPQVVGTARLQKASLYLIETGARLTDINLTAQAANNQQVRVSGSLRAGSGQLNANGTLRLQTLPNWNADLRLQGQNLLLMNTHEIQAELSPDLTIKATPRSLAVSGQVVIPRTVVSLRELPTGANVRSDDIVIVGQGGQRANAPAQPERPLDIVPNVVIRLGNQVSFNGFGLQGRLAGQLRVSRNRQDIAVQGGLNVVDGFYNAYGQRLQIERGRLLFAGPVDNPGLDVRAVRRVENGNITVGIALAGSVRAPESTLFSTPTQTQTDTLSYLLTGRALSNTSGSETAILAQAVAGLGVAGGDSLAQRLGGQLGLDDVGVNTRGGDFKQSELSLGKRLGPKLYVRYIIGLFDSLQRVAVNYEVNKRLHIEATSGVEQSIDLIYKIDTDRGIFGR